MVCVVSTDSKMSQIKSRQSIAPHRSMYQIPRIELEGTGVQASPLGSVDLSLFSAAGSGGTSKLASLSTWSCRSTVLSPLSSAHVGALVELVERAMPFCSGQ